MNIYVISIVDLEDLQNTIKFVKTDNPVSAIKLGLLDISLKEDELFELTKEEQYKEWSDYVNSLPNNENELFARLGEHEEYLITYKLIARDEYLKESTINLIYDVINNISKHENTN